MLSGWPLVLRTTTMSKWEQLKEIKGLIAGLATLVTVLIVIGGFLMEWRVDVNVTAAVKAALADEDLATDSKIIDMDKATATNTSGVAHNKENIDINRENVKAAFEALMGPPPGRDND